MKGLGLVVAAVEVFAASSLRLMPAARRQTIAEEPGRSLVYVGDEILKRKKSLYGLK